jgi:hypothetical protein
MPAGGRAEMPEISELRVEGNSALPEAGFELLTFFLLLVDKKGGMPYS